MYNQKSIVLLGIFVAELVPFGAEEKYMQYGALGILIFLLMYYSYANYKENIRREKASEQARLDLVTANDKEKEILRSEQAEERKILRGQLTALYQNYAKEISEERNRYNELNKEILVLLQNKVK